MTGLLTVAAAWCGLFGVAWWLCRAGDEALADLGPQQHDPDCGACAVADDPTLVSFDLTLWAMECEGAS